MNEWLVLVVASCVTIVVIGIVLWVRKKKKPGGDVPNDRYPLW